MPDPSTSTSTPHQRLQLLSCHLAPPSPALSNMASRDPITCHVLDTTTGRPGAEIVVSLTPLSSPTSIFHGKTSLDGRITNWLSKPITNTPSTLSVSEQITSLIKSLAEEKEGGIVPKGSSLWKLQFATGEYYGVDKTFFPVVELTFLVREGEHFHVPLLLGPYSFTTYRGS